MTEAEYKKRESGQERNDSGRKGGLESFKRSIRTNGQGTRPYVECIGRGFLQETNYAKWLIEDSVILQ